MSSKNMQKYAKTCLTAPDSAHTISVMDAIVAGHICIDLTPGLGGHHPVRSASELMRPGALIDASRLTVSPGGAVSNTGLSLARMGFEVGLVGRVGEDPLAGMLRDQLTAAGGAVQAAFREDAALGTSYSVILSIPGLDRIFLHDAGANDTFSVGDLVAGLDRFDLGGDAPRIMHFGYPTAVASMFRTGPAPLRDLLAAARNRGMTVSVDFSLPDPEGEAAAAPWRAILSAAMPLTDLCFPSVEELSLMLDPTGFAERERSGGGAAAFSADYGYALAGELVAMGAAVVAVKLGGRGLLLRWDPAGRRRLNDTGAIPLWDRLPAGGGIGGGDDDRGGARQARTIDALLVPAYPVETVVSATGAGDAAIAGFLAALLAGDSLAVAAEVGCVAGRNAVTTVDAVSGVQSLDSMNEYRRTASRRSTVSFEDPASWHARTDHSCEHIYEHTYEHTISPDRSTQ